MESLITQQLLGINVHICNKSDNIARPVVEQHQYPIMSLTFYTISLTDIKCMTINTTATELLQSEITAEKMLNINSIPLHQKFHLLYNS